MTTTLSRSANTYVTQTYQARLPLVRRVHQGAHRPQHTNQPLLPWMRRHRSQLAPGRAFDLAGHRYLAAIYQETARRLVLYKAGQLGISEWLISYALHACDQRTATVLYIFPNDRLVSDFSAARFGPAIESSAYLQSIVVEGGARSGKRGSDKITLKRVRDRFLYLRGGQVKVDGSAPQLKSIDADVLIFDELDEMDPRAPEIARKRLGHSAIGEERLVSTPTYPGRGIHAAWLESDQRRWHIPCPSCGRRQALTIDHVVMEWDELGRPMAWHGMDQGRAYAACQHCRAEMDRSVQGEWVAEFPGKSLAGYHVTKLTAQFTDLLDVVTNLQTTDETKRREAFNQDLGLPYRPPGGGLEDDTLDACTREYAHGALPGVRCFLGVDVGKVLHVVVRAEAHAETGERRQLYAGETTWADLPSLIARFDPLVVVVDALPETTKARELQAACREGQLWLAYYVEQKKGTKKEEPADWNEHEGVVNLDRTRTLDETFSRFYERSNSLPGNARDLPDYVLQMKAPLRVLEELADGGQVARYVKTGPDHYAHAENYCAVASTWKPPRRKVASVRVRRRR